tara:strand:+ start:196 stop:918 length:723 start_codon:yes stop_codon:yes gene_type:complete
MALTKITGEGIGTTSGDLTVDVAGDIILDADGGDIILKDGGTEFGRIENQGGDLAIYSSASGHEGLLLGNGAIVPTDNAGSSTDNACNLGGATGRFSNLYLAGGVYLGGTGSANELTDYEEGTYTISEISGQASITNNRVHYTKIGRLVTVQASITVGSTSNSNILNLSLPFSSSIDGFYLGGGNISYTNASNSYAGNNMRPNIENAANNVFFIYNGSTALTCANLSGIRIDFVISYYTE